MASNQSQKDWTSIAVRPDTAQRLTEIMPYETMSKDEFVSELIETYEGTSSDDGR